MTMFVGSLIIVRLYRKVDFKRINLITIFNTKIKTLRQVSPYELFAKRNLNCSKNSENKCG